MPDNMSFPPVVIDGKEFGVGIIRTRNRNAYARVRNGGIVISLPNFLNTGSAERIASSLYNRLQADMKKKPEKYLYQGIRDEIPFADNETVNIMGRDFRLSIRPSDKINASGKVIGDNIIVKVPESLGTHQRNKTVSKIARRLISEEILGKLEGRINAVNDTYFGSTINKVRLTNASTKWGSCSTSKRFKGAKILINFKLLFMPVQCLDYVIVHELAHTKVQNHSRKFWEIVGKIMPDYKERKKALKEYAYVINKSGAQEIVQEHTL